MGEFCEIGQYHGGIGANVVLSAQLAKRTSHVALHQCVEQVNDPGTVGKAKHLPDMLRAHRPGGVRDCLVQE